MSRSRHTGIALIVVLGLLALLAVIVAEIALLAETHAAVGRSRAATEQDALAAYAGSQLARARLSSADASAGRLAEPLRLNLAGRTVTVRLEEEDAKLTPAVLTAVRKDASAVLAESAFKGLCVDLAGLPPSGRPEDLLRGPVGAATGGESLQPHGLAAWLQRCGWAASGTALWASPEKAVPSRTVGSILSGDARGPLNVNTASEAVLKFLGEAFDRGPLIDDIVRERQAAPFESLADLRRRLSMAADAETAMLSLFSYETMVYSAVIAVRGDERTQYFRAVLVRRAPKDGDQENGVVEVSFIQPLARCQVAF